MNLVTDYSRLSAPVLLNRQRMVQVCADSQVDALIATSPPNVAYASGYYCHSHWTNRGTLAFALITATGEEPPTVIAPAMELDAWVDAPPAWGDIEVYGNPAKAMGRELAKGHYTDSPAPRLAPDDQLIYDLGFSYDDPRDAVDTLCRQIHKAGLAKAAIGIDETGIPYGTRAAITDRLPGVQFIDGNVLFQRVRMVKTTAEIERLRDSTLVAGNALTHAASCIANGATEIETWNAYNSAVAAAGGGQTFAVINIGRRSGHTHTLPTDYRPKSGDIVKFDVGCTMGMYHSDIGRTMMLHNANDAFAQAYQALLVGQQAGISALRPGVKPSEVFDTVIGEVRAAGLPEYQRHHVGHGIGLSVYDVPVIQPATSSSEFGGTGSYDGEIEEDMVLNIETPYYVLGAFGAIVEDTVHVTKDGPRILTQLPHDMWCL